MVNIYFIFNNISSDDIKGLLVNKLPPITRAEERVESIPIPGRSGKLHISEESFDSEIKPVECHYSGEDYDRLTKWLNGSGNVVFSNQPDRYYKAYIYNKIPLEAVVYRLKKFLINFDCHPFGYLLQGKEPITITGTTKIYNPGNYRSEPVIKVFGTGNITLNINSSAVNLKNITDYIVIDTEMLNAYRDTVALNNLMVGEFPVLEEGENTISWTGNVSKIELIPKWRCR